MNREILFRGKRIDNGEWVYGSLISRPFGYSENQKEYSAIIIFDKHDGSHYDAYLELQVIPETVGQFTGLTDKNVSKIFEGDKTYGGEIVVFEDGMFGTTYEGNCQGVSTLSNKRCKYMEITGNIYDSPTT